jgi:hypothetical protein
MSCYPNRLAGDGAHRTKLRQSQLGADSFDALSEKSMVACKLISVDHKCSKTVSNAAVCVGFAPSVHGSCHDAVHPGPWHSQGRLGVGGKTPPDPDRCSGLGWSGNASLWHGLQVIASRAPRGLFAFEMTEQSWAAERAAGKGAQKGKKPYR